MLSLKGTGKLTAWSCLPEACCPCFCLFWGICFSKNHKSNKQCSVSWVLVVVHPCVPESAELKLKLAVTNLCGAAWCTPWYCLVSLLCLEQKVPVWRFLWMATSWFLLSYISRDQKAKRPSGWTRTKVFEDCVKADPRGSPIPRWEWLRLGLIDISMFCKGKRMLWYPAWFEHLAIPKSLPWKVCRFLWCLQTLIAKESEDSVSIACSL